MKLEYLVAYSSIGSVLIPLTFSFLHGGGIPTGLKPLRLILIIALSCDVLSFFLVKYSINTYLIGNLYLAAQFFLVMRVFGEAFQNKKVTNLIAILSTLFFLVNITLFQGPWVFNSVSNIVASLILIAICLFYFYRLLNDLPTTHVQHLPLFWISFAVLTYYAGNFFLFLVKNYLIYGESGSHRLMWILHNLLNITKNILFAIALWQSYRKLKSSTLSVSAP